MSTQRRMTAREFEAWLKSITCTAPFTIGDAAELKTLIKACAPDALVDVYTARGDKVHVRVDELRVDLPIV